MDSPFDFPNGYWDWLAEDKGALKQDPRLCPILKRQKARFAHLRGETEVTQGSARDADELPSWLANPMGLFGNVTATEAEGSITLPELIREVQGPRWKTKVEALRALYPASLTDPAAKMQFRAMKKELPGVQLSGTQKTRAKDAQPDERNLQHSGFLQGDFDAKDHLQFTTDQIVERLRQSPFVAAVFRSAGAGVRAVFRIPASADLHLAGFLAASAEAQAMGLVMDPNTKDSGRLSFVSYDPDAWLNIDALELPVDILPDDNELAAPEFEPTDKLNASKVDDIRKLLGMIPAHPDYDQWLRICSSVWNTLGCDLGSELLDEWSPEPGGHQSVSHKALSKIGLGTLYFIASQKDPKRYAAWQEERRVQKDEPQGPKRFFYDGAKYYLERPQFYIPLDRASVARHLKADGVSPTDVDSALNEIQTQRYIHHAGPLAGLPRGLHTFSGKHFLVTNSPEIIEPGTGDWATLRHVITGMLGGDPTYGERQLHTFFLWLKCARHALLAGKRRPGQALVLAGPRDCGKSLLIDIIEKLLGGRRANAHPYFSGKTHFNGDLAGAELLVVDDAVGSTDGRARAAFGASIKTELFAGQVRIESKGRDAFTFPACWRLVIACNDEPESLLVLPPLKEDLVDKIIMLHCQKAPLPMTVDTPREEFFHTLCAEMPAFLGYLEKLTAPPELLERRCGVQHFHHPYLHDALAALAPETHLLELIHSCSELSKGWSGTARELQNHLEQDPATYRDANRLLSWPQACGTFLGRLAQEGRVEQLPLKNGYRRWKIC